MTLTAKATKVYNTMLLNRSLAVEKVENRSTTSQILIISRILEGARAKNLEATLLIVDFSKAFDFIHRVSCLLLCFTAHQPFSGHLTPN